MTNAPSAEELKKILKSENVVIGTDRTIKNLKLGRIKKVFTASNCQEKIEKLIVHYAVIGNAELIKLSYPNDELGVICKKPFSISVLGLKA